MAQASGLQLLLPDERNPLKTSSFGTGQLLSAAFGNGANRVHLAIGGSATNDAGMGMAAALGWRFLDEDGAELSPVGANLGAVETILPPSENEQGSIPQKAVPITVLSDVKSPLFGPKGAAHVFAKQKGASAKEVELLDRGLRHFAGKAAKLLGKDLSHVLGAGAAGGLGFGAMAFLGATIAAGAEGTMQLIGIEHIMQGTNLIITGEGCLDGQTSQGKLVGALCQKARQHGVPVAAICGKVAASASEVANIGLFQALQVQGPGEPLAASIARTATGLEQLAHDFLANYKAKTSY
jgi:glycerate kinase